MTNTTHLKSNHTSSQNNWIFSQQDVELHTPSRQDGISYQQELYQRAFGVDLIVRVSAVRVDVPLLTIATASIFLHRFYMLQSLKKYPIRETSIACLFLAGKVEESLRKVETVVNYVLRLEDRRKGKEPDVHPSSEHFKKLVQQVLYIEEVILINLQFDLTIQHPHPLLTRAAKLYEPRGSGKRLHSKERLALGRASWQILSDIYTTPLCITHTIQILAAAAFLLSWRLLSPDIVPNLDTSDQEWKKYFNEIDWSNKDVMKEIEFVMNSIMDLWGKARNEKFKIGAEELKDGLYTAASFLNAPQVIESDKAQLLQHDTIDSSTISAKKEVLEPTADDAAAAATAPIATATATATATIPLPETQQDTTSKLRNTNASNLEVNTKANTSKEKDAVNGEEGEMEVEEEIESPIKDFSFDHEEPPTPG